MTKKTTEQQKESLSDFINKENKLMDITNVMAIFKLEEDYLKFMEKMNYQRYYLTDQIYSQNYLLTKTKGYSFPLDYVKRAKKILKLMGYFDVEYFMNYENPCPLIIVADGGFSIFIAPKVEC